MSPSSPRKKRTLPFGLISTLLVLSVIAAAAVIYLAKPEEAPTQTGTALIGGDFELVNHKGEVVRDADFRGQYMLVYFGYSFCPDVCPLELQHMADALDMLDKKQLDRITPLFITIDPERDTVAALNTYVALFHPRLQGLTGSVEQIKQAAGAYRVYYQKAIDDASSADYLMDHSSIIFLMGPDGKYVTHFSYGNGPEQIAAKLQKLVK